MKNNQIEIWKDIEGDNPSFDFTGGLKPMLETYLLEGDEPRKLVLILPGGGYNHTSEREAGPIAKEFNEAGHHAIVLYYSVAPHVYPQALLDSARALTLIKEYAKNWHVDMDNVFICGFSAGGHLAASVSTSYEEPWLNTHRGIDLVGITLKGSILCYPVISGGDYRHEGSFHKLLGIDVTPEDRERHSAENRVLTSTPQAFIWHTYEDGSVPVENALLYAMALRKHKIPFELHVFQWGGHGMALGTEASAADERHVDPHVAHWMTLCKEWLEQV